MASEGGTDGRSGGVWEDDDSDDDDSFHQTGEDSGVQLGTVVPLVGTSHSVLFRNVDWHEWDGGKAGGWPVWLNPRDLPAPQDMRCGECTHPLSFLVQLYCPLDHEDAAFHRCLYVFCCPKASCSKNSSVKALRCQLPRENPFYPYEPDDDTKKEALTDTEEASILAKRQLGANPEAWGVNLCCVCGQMAKSACSKCRSARYCGRQHQAQHWKSGGHKKLCGAATPEDGGSKTDGGSNSSQPGGGMRAPEGGVGAPRAATGASVFREYEVEVRPEPPPPPAAPEGRTAEDTLASQMGLGGTGDDEGNDTDGEDDDSKLSQAELDRIAGVHGVKDRVTLQFLTRTQANPQVVRYDAVGAGPLWSSSNGIPESAEVPPCGRCGRARKFEFQVMPHILHHLGVDANTKALDATAATNRKPGEAPNGSGECMDWGTLAVYTCPDSCPLSLESAAGAAAEAGGSGADGEERQAGKEPVACYVEEFVWRQPPP